MIDRKSTETIKLMREGGAILAHVMHEVGTNAREGISLLQLDRLANHLIIRAGAKPAFLGYRPAGATKAYPATICASINDVIVHGVPTKYKLQRGDLLKLDFGLFYKGWCVDAAITVGIDPISTEASKLIKVTKEALDKGIKAMCAGNRLGDIGYAIHRHVKKNGFNVADGLTGHGIGRKLHEDPPVFNVGKRGKGDLLETGVVLALEPMVTVGTSLIRQLADESYVTADHKLSAHFEHTVAITKDGPLVLTQL
ncbi:MAG: type I methionyl aminopeptidase [bacterium]|nr:type I methionyl aminopeptidase [bacterium]